MIPFILRGNPLVSDENDIRLCRIISVKKENDFLSKKKDWCELYIFSTFGFQNWEYYTG